MVNRLAKLIDKIERSEPVDWKQEAALQSLDIVQLGEEFKDEMIGLMDSQDGLSRYSRVKSLEFFETGSIRKVELHEPGISDSAESAGQ